MLKQKNEAFTHIYFSREKRRENTQTDALVVLESLLKLKDEPVRAQEYGDNFILQYDYSEKTLPRVAHTFGDKFAQSLFTLTTGQWSNPIESEYGFHLVRVSHIKKATTPTFEMARNKVQNDYIEHRLEALKEEKFDEIRARYRVHVASPAKMILEDPS